MSDVCCCCCCSLGSGAGGDGDGDGKGYDRGGVKCSTSVDSQMGEENTSIKTYPMAFVHVSSSLHKCTIQNG